jgi:hypothetical protein
MTYAGAVFKGFDDKLASWSPPPGRINDQQCGKTWLQTFTTTNSHFSSSAPLDLLGIVTWDDYEERSEIETGIDNCVQSVAESITGSHSVRPDQAMDGLVSQSSELAGQVGSVRNRLRL